MTQVKSAYRRQSGETHPNAGGTYCDSVQLTRKYEEALKLATLRR